MHPIVGQGSVHPFGKSLHDRIISLISARSFAKGSVGLWLSNSRFHYSKLLSFKNLVSLGFYDPKILFKHLLFLGFSDCETVTF